MSGTLEDQLQQILDIKGDIKNVLNDKGLDAGNDFSTYASKINQIKGEGSCNGFNLFDTKLVDRKLTGNESIGWAEQGTKVYKTDYPDFYNACLKEYNEGSAYSIPKDINVNISGQPVFTHDVVSNLSQTNYIYTPMSFAPAKGDLWEMVVCLSIKQATGRMDFITTDGVTGVCLGRGEDGVLGLSMDGSSQDNGWSIAAGVKSTKAMPNNTKYWIKLEFTGTNYIVSLSQNGYDFEEHINVASTQNMYGKQPLYIGSRRHALTFGSNKVGYPIDGNIYLNECYLKLNGEILWEGTTKTPGIKALNEHVYYNIDVQEDIDYIFKKQQQIPYYGIDTQNEYVILPTIDLYKNIYYCIGNTIIQDIVINLSKEIELNNPFFLGQSQYFENEPNNLSWLKSTGEFHSKEMYPSMYEYILQNINNGTKDFADINSQYDDYCYVLDQENETFRLPLLNGEESLPGDTYELIDFPTSGVAFVAPQNGIYTVYAYATAASQRLFIGNTNTCQSNEVVSHASGNPLSVSVFAKRGHNVRCIYAVNLHEFRFSANKGNGSLYYFVGESIQNANIVNAGKIQSQLIDKLETDLTNLPQESKCYLSGLSLPSNKYIDLELGASGSTYTAPANGLIMFMKKAGKADAFIYLRNITKSITQIAHVPGSANSCTVSVPATKGDIINISYNATGTTEFLRFIYAEGEQ
jgi:hypothetical protein